MWHTQMDIIYFFIPHHPWKSKFTVFYKYQQIITTLTEYNSIKLISIIVIQKIKPIFDRNKHI